MRLRHRWVLKPEWCWQIQHNSKELQNHVWQFQWSTFSIFKLSIRVREAEQQSEEEEDVSSYCLPNCGSWLTFIERERSHKLLIRHENLAVYHWKRVIRTYYVKPPPKKKKQNKTKQKSYLHQYIWKTNWSPSTRSALIAASHQPPLHPPPSSSFSHTLHLKRVSVCVCVCDFWFNFKVTWSHGQHGEPEAASVDVFISVNDRVDQSVTLTERQFVCSGFEKERQTSLTGNRIQAPSILTD